MWCWVLVAGSFGFPVVFQSCQCSKWLLSLKKELKRWLPAPYSSWFEFENLYFAIPWSGVKTLWAFGGLKRAKASQDEALSDRQTSLIMVSSAPGGTSEVVRIKKEKEKTALSLSHYSLSHPQLCQVSSLASPSIGPSFLIFTPFLLLGGFLSVHIHLSEQGKSCLL